MLTLVHRKVRFLQHSVDIYYELFDDSISDMPIVLTNNINYFLYELLKVMLGTEVHFITYNKTA